MPIIIRTYLRSALFGVLLSCCFVAALLALDVAGLRHLILGSDIGWLAVVMLLAFNAILFGGVQFAIVVMGQAESDASSGGGRRASVGPRTVQVVAVAAHTGGRSAKASRYRGAND